MRLIIVGAGIVGSSVAYHLAQRGWTDVLVLDKGPIPHNHGSTSHAPGGMHVVNPSRMMTNFARYSVELYKKLGEREKGNPCLRQTGGIEVAIRDERWHDLKRKYGIAKAYGVDSHLLTPKEVQEIVPHLDPNVIKGGFYVPDDANALGVDVTALLTEGAKGIEFRANTPVSNLVIENGRVTGVETAEGRLTADTVLLCNNIWSPVLAAQAGVKIPLLAAQHQYTVTEPLAELADYKDREIVMPIMRSQDYSVYHRQHYDCWGIGNYRHEPLMVDPTQVGVTAMRDFTEHHYEIAKKASAELFPGTATVGLQKSFNGMFAFTIDGYPIMGPTSAPGLWICAGIWLTHAGGVGKALAEWLDEGATELETSQADVARFHPHQATKRYINLRCAQNYREVYDIIHPRQPIGTPRGLLRAPFHQQLKELGAHFFEAGGWEMPQWYESNSGLCEEFKDQIPERDDWGSQFWSPIQGAEHLAVRARGGLFSLAALAPIEVRGPQARAFLEEMAANRVAKAPRITYSAFLNNRGGIRADLTFIERRPGVFWVFTGGAILPRDITWFKQHAVGREGVEIVDRSQGTTAVGLWGPKAREVLQSVCDQDVSHKGFPFYTFRELEIGSIPVLALRMSYAGELGWEIHVDASYGSALWDALWPECESRGMVAAGSGAFDSLRLEKGYRLWGSDMDTEKTPFEAGLGYFVKLDKGNFLGKDTLTKAQEPKKRLCCLEVDGQCLGGEPVLHEGKGVGYVTSANYGYSVRKMLAFTYLPAELAEVGQTVEVQYFAQKQLAKVITDPAFDPKSERMRQ